MRYRQAAFDDGQRTAANDAFQALDEIGTMAEVNSVREPDDFDIGSGCKESLDCRQRIRAIEAIRLGLDLFDLNAGGAGGLHGNVTAGLSRTQQRNAAIVC